VTGDRVVALPFEELLESWRFARDSVIAEFENIPASSWEFRPTPAQRTVAELAQHIIDSGLLMSGELSRPDGDFTRQPYDAFAAEYGLDYTGRADRDSLLALLRQTHDDGEAALRQAGAGRLGEPIRQFNGVPAARATWMTHGIAHEEYHRGQIAVYARLLGLVPKLTQLIEGGSG
jgi:uncharacterized damage-inducible protein DinB